MNVKETEPQYQVLGHTYISRQIDSLILRFLNSVHSLFQIRKIIFNFQQQWHPTPVLLPGKSHGQRSLVGCSPWGHEESDTIERLPFHFALSCIGEGNGNPLQYPCLENPRDGGAQLSAVSGVAQSRTRLKRLSIRSILQCAGSRTYFSVNSISFNGSLTFFCDTGLKYRAHACFPKILINLLKLVASLIRVDSLQQLQVSYLSQPMVNSFSHINLLRPGHHIVLKGRNGQFSSSSGGKRHFPERRNSARACSESEGSFFPTVFSIGLFIMAQKTLSEASWF